MRWQRGTRVMGYTYLADYHCVGCTHARLRDGQGLMHKPEWMPDQPGEDETGLPYATYDTGGNAVHPVFGTDEGPTDEDGNRLPAVCGDCGAEVLP